MLDVLTADRFWGAFTATGHTLAVAVESIGRPAGRHIPRVVGTGLLRGVELHHGRAPWSIRDVNRLRLACHDHGLLTSYADLLLPLVPPRTLTDDECSELADKLEKFVLDVVPGR